MAELRTWEQIQLELAASVSWMSQRSVALAKRRLDATLAALTYPSTTDERGQRIEFTHQSWQQERDMLIAFLAANDVQSASEQLSNPSVLHADFSTFGQYGGG